MYLKISLNFLPQNVLLNSHIFINLFIEKKVYREYNLILV